MANINYMQAALDQWLPSYVIMAALATHISPQAVLHTF